VAPVGYAELLARLYAARRAGVVFELSRVRAVLDRLGAPDARLGAVVHVGGTNGKGSVAAMVAAVAAAAGARVGVYGSPHLASLRERVQVGGALVGEAALCAAAERVWAAGGEGLTFFEQVTAMAMCVLADAAPDVTVLEVGLGGRLDATNVVAAPVAVVTGVAMDHQAYLGDTLRAIAGEKAGIWKPGQRAVIGASGEPEAVPWLVDAARAAAVASLVVIDDAAITAAPPVALAGAHQRANAAAALAAIDGLEAIGVRADGAARARGLAAVHHPGRLEEVATAPRVVLDGAHNPHGARALAAWAAGQGERPRVLVLAVSADKDVAALAAALAGAFDAVVATRYAQPRALDPSALAAAVRAAGAGVVDEADDVDAAIARARARAGPGGLVVVAGSLFAVGEARSRLVGGPVDPIVVSDPVGPGGPAAGRR
jgi:dihydrofolate synthase / folylpolyglutamate synthase